MAHLWQPSGLVAPLAPGLSSTTSQSFASKQTVTRVTLCTHVCMNVCYCRTLISVLSIAKRNKKTAFFFLLFFLSFFFIRHDSPEWFIYLMNASGDRVLQRHERLHLPDVEQLHAARPAGHRQHHVCRKRATKRASSPSKQREGADKIGAK